MRSRFLAIASSMSIALVLAPATQAAPPTAPAGSFSFQWLKAGCFTTNTGYRAIGTIRTTINSVLADSGGTPSSVYYQEVKVQIDRQSGYAGTGWSQISGASKVYDWTRFNSNALPTYSTSAVKTGLPTSGMMTAKATVWLKRVRSGPDKTVWRARVRSQGFQCVDPNMVSLGTSSGVAVKPR